MKRYFHTINAQGIVEEHGRTNRRTTIPPTRMRRLMLVLLFVVTMLTMGLPARSPRCGRVQ
jgi:hypothetical protein